MKNLLLLFKRRHYSSLISRTNETPSSKESKILQLCRSGSLLEAIGILNTVRDSNQISIKPVLYASLLQTCTKTLSFHHGLQFHAHLIKSGLETDRFVGNSLLALYFKLGTNFSETRRVFDGLIVKDVISWSCMISGYIRVGKPRESLVLYSEMLGFDVEPSGFTLSAVIKACSELAYLKLGKCFHGAVFRHGFDSNHVIVSSLIDMYGKNNGCEESRQLFDELLQPDAICWTAVISAFTRNELYEKALSFFVSMQRSHGLFADGFTYGSVLTACGNLGRLRQGREVHAKVVTSGIRGNVIVESSLVDMYGKCGSLLESHRVFDRILKKNAVSWGALLGGYCQNKDYHTVIKLFRVMERVDLYILGTILRACAGLAILKQGKEVHCQYLRRGGWRDVVVESALVDLYSKCGSIAYAKTFFKRMEVKNLVSWNSIISGFAQNGKGEEAVAIFDQMVKECIRPDYISFIGVLFACSHAGLVDQGRAYFNSMHGKYGIKAGIEHYSCMVDLLGRAGLLEEAECLLMNAECSDDSSLWATLLGACTTSTSPETAERIAKKMLQLDPNHHLSYILLSNVYKAVGRWNDALITRRLMEERGVNKPSGKSWVEGNGKLVSSKRIGFLKTQSMV